MSEFSVKFLTNNKRQPCANLKPITQRRRVL